MEKIGSLQFYKDVDFNIEFSFDELMDDFKKTILGVKNEFFDENETLKLDIIDKYVKEYVNRRIREKFGEDFSLDTMDDTLNLSWNIKVETIKKHKTEQWWDEETSSEVKLPKLKKK